LNRRCLMENTLGGQQRTIGFSRNWCNLTLTEAQNLINFKKTKGSSKIGKIKINSERCKGCGYCIQFCPLNLIHFSPDLNRKGYYPAIFDDNNKCTGCGICALVCPDTAITVYRNLKEKK